jgi:hypothetical protein
LREKAREPPDHYQVEKFAVQRDILNTGYSTRRRDIEFETL